MMAGKGFGHEGSQNGSPGVSSSSQGQTVPLQQRSADHELLMKVSALQSTNGCCLMFFRGLFLARPFVYLLHLDTCKLEGIELWNSRSGELQESVPLPQRSADHELLMKVSTPTFYNTQDAQLRRSLRSS